MKISKLRATLKSRWISFAIAALIFSCGGGITILRAADITAHLTIVYSSSGSIDSSNDWPACSSTVKTLCITGFNIYDLTGGQRKLLFKMANAAATSGQQTVTETHTVSGFSYGTHPLVATVAIIDVSGSAAEGPDSAQAQCVYAPGTAPTVIFNSATAK